jgi:preprotein translocase subunit SecG
MLRNYFEVSPMKTSSAMRKASCYLSRSTSKIFEANAREQVIATMTMMHTHFYLMISILMKSLKLNNQRFAIENSKSTKRETGPQTS